MVLEIAITSDLVVKENIILLPVISWTVETFIA